LEPKKPICRRKGGGHDPRLSGKALRKNLRPGQKKKKGRVHVVEVRFTPCDEWLLFKGLLFREAKLERDSIKRDGIIPRLPNSLQVRNEKVGFHKGRGNFARQIAGGKSNPHQESPGKKIKG